MASGSPFPPPPPYDPAASSYAPGAAGQAEYPWLAPASLPNAAGGLPSGWPAGSGRAPMYELRPLSTGEILDRTFSLYRSRFLLFAGIASLAAAVQLLGQVVQLLILHAMMKGRVDVATLGASRGIQVASNLLGFASLVVFLLAFAVTQAATVWAMGEVYLGRGATVSSALRATAGRWLRYLGIALWQVGSFVWLPFAVGAVYAGLWFANGRSLGGFGAVALLVLLLIAAMVGGLIFYLRNLLAVPVTVREGVGMRASMRRSKVLAQGGKGKLFLVLLIAFALYLVVATLAGVAIAVTAVSHRGNPQGLFYPAQIIGSVLGFAGYTVISPVVMIGTAMVYFDQRVRKEAFDVAVLLGDESANPPAPPTAAPLPSVTETPFAAETAPLTVAASGFAATPVLSTPETAVGAGEAAAIAAEPSVTEPEGGASGL